MSDTGTTIARDKQNGRFLAGNAGSGGRKPGARNKLGEAFIADLADTWREHGAEALRRCAVEEPAQFCRVIASLMPRDLNINHDVNLDVATFAEKFRNAVELLHQPQPGVRTIEHVPGKRR
ncbi:hypothetical protein [Bradyrhizobium sp. AUGA SZCCT0042]|uniref:hypothetical protein n=1 Tax=Bradyrhizobium sp. AUGA SZCCT0042 TaxID=2807651 RepID=UPI001BACDD72|nr:hypothetical protein [Bradyrhizobium sp. AUGA SZCCT0042]MBR1298556.1 hypothetical protein [Bradyrhizobium sp. AUGA SZCCT0042]